MKSKKSRASALRPRLQIECLEDRLAMAGNVVVSESIKTVNHLNVANLSITGDAAENSISITASNGQWLFTGNNGTTVQLKGTNNQLPVLALGIPQGGFGKIAVDLKEGGSGGADSFSISGVPVHGALGVKGKNAGVVQISDVTIEGETKVQFGSGQSSPGFGSFFGVINSSLGNPLNQNSNKFFSATFLAGTKSGTENNTVLIAKTTVGKDLTIATGGGNDTIGVGSLQPGQGTLVRGNLTIATNAGTDRINLVGINVNGDTSVSSGDDNDEVKVGFTDAAVFRGNAKFDLGGGAKIDAAHPGDRFTMAGVRTDVNADTPSSSAFVLGDLNIKKGGGDVRVGLLGTVVAGDLTIDGKSAGNDFIGGTDVFIRGKTTIKTGAGNDTVAVVTQFPDTQGGLHPDNPKGNRAIGNVTIDTGDGDDMVAAQGITFDNKVTVTLGAGDDSLLAVLNTFKLGQTALAGVRGGGTANAPGNDSLLGDLPPLGNLLGLIGFEHQVDPISDPAFLQDIAFVAGQVLDRAKSAFGDLL